MSKHFYDKKQLNKSQKSFDKSLSLLSESRQEEVKKQREEVQKEIDSVNSNMNTQFDVEAQMRQATGLHHRDAEILMYQMKDLVERGKLQVGQTYVFKDKSFVWTPYSTVVNADLYISSMQDAVLKLSEAVGSQTFNVTNLSFFDLIKLAFKRLFKQGN